MMKIIYAFLIHFLITFFVLTIPTLSAQSSDQERAGLSNSSETNASAFITTWKTDNPGVSDDQSIRIPLIGNGYAFNVDWGDGTNENYTANPGSSTTHSVEHTYSDAGTYTVSITGDFPRIFLNNGGTNLPNDNGDHKKLISIDQWGYIEWISMAGAFYGAINLTYNADDVPDLSNVSSMECMFCQAEKFNGAIGDWDMSSITNMEFMFLDAAIFNQDIGNWDVSNVTNMSRLFERADAFNQDIGEWDVSSVQDMSGMFYFAELFNQDIGDWNVSNVTNMREMFSYAKSFNQDIGRWNVKNVTDMVRMFNGAFVFNQDIGDWDVSSVTNMLWTFRGAVDFNQDIGNWDVGSVENMASMFLGAETFNQVINDWNVSNVKRMDNMFQGATAFDQNIGNWDVSSVETMSRMFWFANNFDGDIGDWNVSSVEDMNGMFAEASAFNQDISNWDVSSVVDMTAMFGSAEKFNIDIGKWDVVSVTSMRGMFAFASSFNHDLSSWNVSGVTDMFGLFSSSESFNQDLGSWDFSSVITMDRMLENSGLSTENYDATLIGWATQEVQSDLTLGATGLTYCDGAEARQSLIDGSGWTIIDAGLATDCVSTNLNEDDNLPISFSLNQNYPNPFNPTTLISFDLQVSGQVRLVIYDLMGRAVQTLVNGSLSAGSHDVTFDASQLSSGVYLYRLDAPGFISTRKMMLVK